MKSDNVLHWRRDYAFVFMGNKRLWILSRLTEIRFDWGRPPQYHDYRYRQGEPIKSTGQVTCKMILDCSAMKWDMTNLVGYWVLTTYYYMPSFHMAWIEIYIMVWLYSPNRLIKLTDAFYLLKHKAQNHL